MVEHGDTEKKACRARRPITSSRGICLCRCIQVRCVGEGEGEEYSEERPTSSESHLELNDRTRVGAFYGEMTRSEATPHTPILTGIRR